MFVTSYFLDVEQVMKFSSKHTEEGCLFKTPAYMEYQEMNSNRIISI